MRWSRFAFGSLLLHLAVLGATAWAAPSAEVDAPDVAIEESGRLRLVGETFDVEAPDPPVPEHAAPAEPAAPQPPASLEPTAAEPAASETRDTLPNGASSKGETKPSTAPPRASTSTAAREQHELSGRASSTPSSAASPSGSFGEEGVEAPTVQLRRAFVKTLPLAARGDPAWLELPLGSTFEGSFVLRVDESGLLDGVTMLEAKDDALSRAAIKNRLFLRAGRFAVREARRGELRLHIRARIEQHAPLGAEDSSDGGGVGLVTAIGMRIDPSSQSAPPTGAYFTYGSGRHVEFEVSEIAP